MRRSPVRARMRASAAFSLIEIMLALAIIAIGLIAIVGLIPRGVQASREAADNTLAATLAHDALNSLRQSALQPPWPPAMSDYYYDMAGTNQTTSASADTYFRVQLSAPEAMPNLLAQNALTVVATVTWPFKSPTAVPPNTNIFVTTIANYQQP